MLRRVVIGVSLACLLGGAAYAEDPMQKDGEVACNRQLAATEEALQDKLDADALSEAETDKINELLDEADAQCAEGNMDGATKTLAIVSSMLKK